MFDLATIKKISIFALVILSSCRSKLTTIESWNVYPTRQYGFAQAVVYDKVIYSSGQVGWNKDYFFTGNSDFQAQFKQSLHNIEQILAEVNGDWQDIIHLRFYIIGLDSSKRELVGKFLKATFQKAYKPATTIIGVTSLARENLLIEIEFTAKVNSK